MVKIIKKIIAGIGANGVEMTEKEEEASMRKTVAGSPPEKTARQKRLEQALKQNLLRRKASAAAQHQASES